MSAEGSATINLKVKMTTQVIDITVQRDASISQVKEILVSKIENATKDQLCLIFSGKILKDQDTLNTHNIGDGMAIHLVVRQGQQQSNRATQQPQPQPNRLPPMPPISPMAAVAAAARSGTLPNSQNTQNATPRSAPGIGSFGAGGAGLPPMENIQGMAHHMMSNPDMMRQMMDNPIMQNIMNNPDLIRAMVTSNPQIQQVIESNPELGHVLNDPDLMRQTMEMVRNPNMFQEMMRNHDQAIRNLQGIPGGEAALQRLYEDVQEPLLNSAANSLGGNPFASLRTEENNQSDATSRSQRAGVENSEALPNPWSGGNSNQGGQDTSGGHQAPAGLYSSAGMDSLMRQMMNDPNTMQQMMSPEIQNMMRQSISQNPQLVQNILMNSPMAQQNPEMAAQIRDQMPAIMNMMTNPDIVQAMSNPRITEALRQIQQGMDIIRREAPHLQSFFGPGPGAVPPPSNPAGANADLMNMFSQMAGMNFNRGAAPQETANPEELYASQLEQLAGMGFTNRAQNIAALSASFGDLNGAVERLLNS